MPVPSYVPSILGAIQQPVIPTAAPFDYRKGIYELMGSEGARIYEGGASTPEPLPLGSVRHRVLSPAVRFQDGSVEIANKGEHHWDAYEKGRAKGKISADDGGWVDNRTGQYLTRSQVDDLFTQKALMIEDYLAKRASRK